MIKIQNIISFILLLIVAYLFFRLGSDIKKEGKPITDFCKEHYNNKTFLETTTYFTEDDPSEPLQCQSKTWRKGFWGYCNSTCFKQFDKCLEENATEDQIYFMENCHWMGSDYLILAGTVLFEFGFSAIFIVMSIAILFQKKEEIENDNKHNN